MFSRFAPALVLVTASIWTAGCASAADDNSGAEETTGALETGSSSSVSTLDCEVGDGVSDHDDVAKFTFKVKAFQTPGAKFVESGWKVLDKDGHALESDGNRSSVVAEGFSNGVDIRQCKKKAGRDTTCGSFVAALDNSGSEMPVTITLTKKSNYLKGTLTIDNTINTGDNSGWLHAPLTCTIAR
jgi:hypothetical protein